MANGARFVARGVAQAAKHPQMSIHSLCVSQGTNTKDSYDIFDDEWFSYFFDAANHAAGVRPVRFGAARPDLNLNPV